MSDWMWVLVSIPAWIVHDRFLARFQCDCGRMRVPYFSKRHEKVWTAWLRLGEYVVFEIIGALGIVLGDRSWGDRILFILIGLCIGVLALRIYYHEKDKVRKAARALGKVIINENGRLAVVKEGR